MLFLAIICLTFFFFGPRKKAKTMRVSSNGWCRFFYYFVRRDLYIHTYTIKWNIFSVSIFFHRQLSNAMNKNNFLFLCSKPSTAFVSLLFEHFSPRKIVCSVSKWSSYMHLNEKGNKYAFLRFELVYSCRRRWKENTKKNTIFIHKWNTLTYQFCLQSIVLSNEKE